MRTFLLNNSFALKDTNLSKFTYKYDNLSTLKDYPIGLNPSIYKIV